MSWSAAAPSNIALIKYMGKKDADSNLPDNASLSYTLPNLLSHVSLEHYAGKQDIWAPFFQDTLTLSEKAQQRFLQHLSRLKNHFQYTGHFIVRSTNTFPHSSGLASSASSFAALTLCAVKALCELTNTPIPSLNTQASLSRQGSGSSCRSFFAPWALWEGEDVKPVTLPYTTLIHHVILISNEEKDVSSSEAHQRVKCSPHYGLRLQRAARNLGSLLDALRSQCWQKAYEVCWEEFQDMHTLFTSCDKPFSYKTPQTEAILQALQALWEQEQDGPLITMDAGPNIHLLYRPDQTEMITRMKNHPLIRNYHGL